MFELPFQNFQTSLYLIINILVAICLNITKGNLRLQDKIQDIKNPLRTHKITKKPPTKKNDCSCSQRNKLPLFKRQLENKIGGKLNVNINFNSKSIPKKETRRIYNKGQTINHIYPNSTSSAPSSSTSYSYHIQNHNSSSYPHNYSYYPINDHNFPSSHPYVYPYSYIPMNNYTPPNYFYSPYLPNIYSGSSTYMPYYTPPHIPPFPYMYG